jgi:hypothetical protein
MIQKTAIWILATLALCSPGTVITRHIREPIGAFYEIRSIQIATDGVRQTISRIIYRPAANAGESVEISLECPTAASPWIFFGSLYNRPPPASLL